jgi:hypothetical protein
MSRARCSGGGHGHDRVVDAASASCPHDQHGPSCVSSWVAARLDPPVPAGIVPNLRDINGMVITVIILARMIL